MSPKMAAKCTKSLFEFIFLVRKFPNMKNILCITWQDLRYKSSDAFQCPLKQSKSIAHCIDVSCLCWFCRLINWHVRQLLRKKLGYHLVTFANETIVSPFGADTSTDSNSTTRWAQGSQSTNYTINRCKHKANSSVLVRGNLILCLWRLICTCSFILASWQLKAWWALLMLWYCALIFYDSENRPG